MMVELKRPVGVSGGVQGVAGVAPSGLLKSREQSYNWMLLGTHWQKFIFCWRLAAEAMSLSGDSVC